MRNDKAYGPGIGRRRFIGIVGAAAGLSAMPLAVRAGAVEHHWSGVALGARASITLLHPDAAAARRVLRLAVQEIERLESIFSLYRADSAVSRLNRAGSLATPPLELVDLLTRAGAVSAASGGAFDITVQPLWQRFRDHFAANPQSAGLPPVDDLLALVDWRGVEVDSATIAFRRPGMAITLNGIAQGYVTDAVAELLGRNGIGNVALNLGETRTLGLRGDDAPWQIGIADPATPTRLAGRLAVGDRAVATSGGHGTVFDGQGRFGHLLDPRTGTTAPTAGSITVAAEEACLADAWSTAFCLMDTPAIRAAAHRINSISVYAATEGRGLRQIA